VDANRDAIDAAGLTIAVHLDNPRNVGGRIAMSLHDRIVHAAVTIYCSVPHSGMP
jgi:hypothetical protein